VERRSPCGAGCGHTFAEPISAKQLVLMILREPNGLYKLHFCNDHLDPRASLGLVSCGMVESASMEPPLQLLTAWNRTDSFVLERS
jgi:hypothetical protein